MPDLSNPIDKDGYPRSDISYGDLHTYKDTKRQIAELTNDLK